MERLNDRAYRLLKDAIENHCQRKGISDSRRELALLRLEKLRRSAGKPATGRELRAMLADILPGIDDRAIRDAAKANGKTESSRRRAAARTLGIAGAIAGGVMVIGGGIAFANIPFPPVRKLVGEHAPILLLPSFFQMDSAYRGAIDAVEQADRLIAGATSAADLDRGRTQVTAAKASLDRLPVWFLGYQPKAYCTLFGCQWRFTFDEFQAARQRIAKLDAQLFQEINAQKALESSTAVIHQAKDAYNQNPNSPTSTTAIANWQAGIDTLRELPPQTLAGRQAAAKLPAYERDFRAAAGYSLGNQTVGNAIAVAKEYAARAAQATQNPPHPVETWARSSTLWTSAIEELKSITPEDPDYVGSRKRLAEYEDNLAMIQQRQAAEASSVKALNQAKDDIARWQTMAAEDNSNPALIGLLQSILNQLDRVRKGTTAYAEAQTLRQFANAKLAAP